MRIGIIGPTDIDVTSRSAGLDPATCKSTAKAAGEELARRGCTMVVVPDRGVALLAARAYQAADGPRLIGIIPHGGTSAQATATKCDVHRHLCLLAIGLSCGTMSEIAWTKWVGSTPVVVIKPLVSGIPPEVEAETDLHWVDNLDGFFRFLDGLCVQGVGDHAS